jgi:hypothetical protein
MRIISKINVGETITESMEVVVRLDRSFMVRSWIALQAIRLAALICPIVISLEDKRA